MGRKVDYLVGLCAEYGEMLEKIHNETGLEGTESILYSNGQKPAYQRTIENLLKHIDKQEKWLKQRKEEVTKIHKALEHANERKNYYKGKVRSTGSKTH